MVNAIILAGGLGTRLRPYTETIPKPLMPMKGKPVLQHIIEGLARHGIVDIILSIGYKAETVRAYFGDGSAYGVRITYIEEREPLGTGGAVKIAAQGMNAPFFLVWGDNLTDVNYTALYHQHLQQPTMVTMTLTHREDVENFGVAKLSGTRIISFVEKPKREDAPSILINAGAFVIDPRALSLLPEGKSSIEKDCFEKLAPKGEIMAYVYRGQWFPTDTLEKFRHACEQYQPRINWAEKKVIIADVDDTICESCQQISPEMASRINGLIQQGYSFAFISGTRAEDLQNMISSRLTEPHHILATTGTKYVQVQGSKKKVVYHHSFSETEKKEILGAFHKLIQHHNIHSMTTPEDQLQDRDSQITLSAIGRHAPSDAKAQFDPNGEKRKQWVEYLLQHLDEQKYDIKIGGTTSIDVTKKGLNKEWGIREFAQHNGVALNCILFFGDKIYPEGNDFPAARIVDCVSVKNPRETLEKLKQLP